MDRELLVYVVDDNRDSADSLASLIEHLGHRAVACYDAARVLSLSRQIRPGCVMLDVTMAGMNGLELARELRAMFGDDVILVAVTGASRENPVVEQTFELVDHYFVKPIELERLQRLLAG